MYFTRFVCVLMALSLLGAAMVVQPADASAKGSSGAQQSELNIESADLVLDENFDFVGKGRFDPSTKHGSASGEVLRVSQLATASLTGCADEVATEAALLAAVECYNTHTSPGHYVLELSDSITHDGFTVSQPDPDSRLTIVGTLTP